MYFTDNPVADWDRHCVEEEQKLAHLPKCALCGEPIGDDICYEINDKIICTECLNDHYRKWTEDYMEEKQ